MARAARRGDWSLIERLADTRSLQRARAVGLGLASTLPAEEARLDAWLEGPKAPAAIFALARQAETPDVFFGLVRRICRTHPLVVARLMPSRWASAPYVCMKHLKPLLAELSPLRPYPSRTVRALLAGCHEAGSAELLEFLAGIVPGRDAKTRALAAEIAGNELLSERTNDAARILIRWLDQKGLRRLAKEAVREARRRVAEHPEKGLRERLVALRTHPELSPLL